MRAESAGCSFIFFSSGALRKGLGIRPQQNRAFGFDFV